MNSSTNTSSPCLLSLALAAGLFVNAIVTPAALADEAEYRAPAGREGPSPYSEAVIYDDFIFLAGHLGTDPATGKLAEGGIGPETEQAMKNMQATLERAGGSMDSVLKCTVFLADIAEWSAMNAVYTTFFTNMPARSAIGNAGLALGARIEVECLAAAPD